MNLWLLVVSGVVGLGLAYTGYLLFRALAVEREHRQRLEETNRNLEARIVERTQELSSVYQELNQRHQQLEAAYHQLARTQRNLAHSEKMASLGLLMAGVAHKLSNPISFVHGNLEFIGEYADRLAAVIDAYSGADQDDPRKRRAGDLEKEKANVEATLKTLRELISTCYPELARAQQHLVHSEKMASLGLLVAGVAHELNNPISFVHGNLEFIGEYADRLATVIDAYSGSDQADLPSRRAGDRQKEKTKVGTTLKTLRELIASCREGTERVKKIVLDLRTFSRADDSGPVLADLHEGIESTLNLLAKEYRQRITVHRDYGQLPAVECYSGQINQVFMNLLLNAAQSIPGQGDVWIRTTLQDDRMIITIRDNGNGIPEQDLHRIFDPFFTTKPVGTGTGLGLSISYGIIEKHGGKIHIKSQVNVGTEFTIELPLHLNRKEHETLRVATRR